MFRLFHHSAVGKFVLFIVLLATPGLTGKAFALAVDCSSCHVVHQNHHTNVHDQTVLPDAMCTECHDANVVIEHTDKRAIPCEACHNETFDGVIVQGVNNTPVDCGSCHADLGHLPLHDKALTGRNCSPCHIDDIITTHTSNCAGCHANSEPMVMDAIAMGRSGMEVDCETCHGSGYGHQSGPHTRIEYAQECAGCHMAPDIIEMNHKQNCAGCHGSLDPAVQSAIADGRSGMVVNCARCHGPHNGPAVHDNLKPFADCVPCHTASAFSEIVVVHRNDCLTCHQSSDLNVGSAIFSGINGAQVDCQSCHSSHDAEMVHDRFMVVAECAGCHQINTFVSVVTAHRNDCGTCHASNDPNVIAVIAAGQGDSGAPVNCGSCHSGHDPETAHDMLQPSPVCSSCHLNSDFYDITLLHRDDCLTCHNSMWPAAVQAIADGQDGIPVGCESCHVDLDHTSGHDFTGTPEPVCNNCHNANVAVEHVDIRGRDCGICHTDPAYAQIIADGRAGTMIDCTACHTSSSHKDLHDQTMVPSDGCIQCHDANVVTEHIDNRSLGCVTCHSSPDPGVLAAIAKGISGAPVFCDDCHTGIDHGVFHDQTFMPQPECGACHYANVVTEHVDKQQRDCFICHTNPDPTVSGAIVSGAGGTPVYCGECHTAFTDHALAHDMTVTPDPFCVSCHDADVGVEHVGNRGLLCTVCHTNPEYEAIISEGKNGAAIGCDRCHGTIDHSRAHDQTMTNPGNCTDCHSGDVAIEHVDNRLLDCSICHSSSDPLVIRTIADGKAGTPVYCSNCHTAVDHVSSHDMVSLPQTACGDCHAVNVVTEHVTNRGLACLTCHDNPAFAATIAAGMAGTPVDCQDCHGPVDHPAAHDMTVTTEAYCADCHAANVVVEHVDKRGLSCLVCHDNEAYIAIINNGMAGGQISCAACHGAINHTLAHDMVGVPQPGCTNCHDGNVVTEHVTNRGYDCNVCHGDPAFAGVIADGMAGVAGDCLSCHGQPQHHGRSQAVTGDCNYCHQPPAWAADAPVQGACRQCHIDSRGYVQGRRPIRTVHAINSSGSIKDFGACFACHAPDPYHAKPATAPKWWETDTEIAPGRGSFNIFYNEFRRRKEYYEGNGSSAPVRGYEDLEEYGEEVISRRQGFEWQSPAIEFDWMNIDHSGTIFTVPTFDIIPGGGTPPSWYNIISSGGSWGGSYGGSWGGR